MKMTAHQAKEFVKAWKADALWGAVQHVFDESQKLFFPFGYRVRVLLGSGNKLANNALWQNKDKTALLALMKYGLEQNTTWDEVLGSARFEVITKDSSQRDFNSIKVTSA